VASWQRKRQGLKAQQIVMPYSEKRPELMIGRRDNKSSEKHFGRLLENIYII